LDGVLWLGSLFRRGVKQFRPKKMTAGRMALLQKTRGTSGLKNRGGRESWVKKRQRILECGTEINHVVVLQGGRVSKKEIPNREGGEDLFN